jgi:hypothetical protein
MARGWESKSVEQQQEEMLERQKTNRAPVPPSPEAQQRIRKRQGLQLSRQRLTQQLQAASNPRHRQMLEQAIGDVDSQLASFEHVTDVKPPK